MWTPFSNKHLSLQPDEAHVWSVSKSAHENRVQAYWDILDTTEKERAMKFRFLKDRLCFIIARGVLRNLLATYTYASPEDIAFSYGFNGKPYIDHKSDIQFNVSHSGDTILLGFVQKYDIGVDVEHTKRHVEVEKVARCFFSNEEITSLLSLDRTYHTQAFYNCWTRKEAFIKALGSGLAFPLDQFVVSLDSTKEATLIDTKWDAKEKEKWVLQSMEPQQDYIGAISIKGAIHTIQTWAYA